MVKESEEENKKKKVINKTELKRIRDKKNIK